MKEEMKDLFIEYFSKINIDDDGNVTNYDEVLSQEFMNKLLEIESDIKSFGQEVEHLSNDEDTQKILLDEIKDDIVRMKLKSYLGDILFELSNKLKEAEQSQPEQTEEAIEEKSEQEKSAEQTQDAQKEPLGETGDDINVTGMSEPQPQTLEPANQNVPVMLNVAGQAQDTQKEPLNVEAKEEAEEEKSEQEKSAEQTQDAQKGPLGETGDDVKIAGMSKQTQPQTLEPANQNVPVMLNVAGQTQDAQKGPLEEAEEEVEEEKSEAEQKGNMEKEDIESMMETRQRLIEGRVNKINNDVKYLIDPTKINRIQRFVKSESVDYNTQEAFANMSLSFNSMLREEISVLHVENSVLLEEKRRLNMELSAYKKMCESKNAEIMSDNIKIKEVNIKTSARLKFIKDSIEEQVKNDTDFRQLVMAKYNEVQYNEPEKEITEEQKQQEMQNDKQLFDDTYNKFRSTEQNFMNRFINLRSELLALTGAIKSAEEDKNKGLK